MTIRLFSILSILLLGFSSPLSAQSFKSVPDNLYSGLEYLLTVPKGNTDLDTGKISDLVSFVRSAQADVSMSLQDRDKAAGGFHAFTLRGDLKRVVEYAYNPDIPAYVTMPSSVRDQQWLDASSRADLTRLAAALDKGSPFLMRGTEQETITPDANTGGYYVYRQDRAVGLFQGETGPVLVSMAIQSEPSEVGKKGCVVGDDSNWNYLYSGETGLNKTGLGWVDSYMYKAHSVIVFVADSQAGVVHVGSFKWLDAGWAKVNMVKQSHIINGIKRFAADFKTVLESPRLPGSGEIAAMYRELSTDSPETLRGLVAPYLDAVSRSGSGGSLPSPFKGLLASGDYLKNMSQQEMVKVVIKEFLKQRLGRAHLLQVAQAGKIRTSLQ